MKKIALIPKLAPKKKYKTMFCIAEKTIYIPYRDSLIVSRFKPKEEE